MTFKKIRFVADSVCDLPPEVVGKFDVGIVPCFINYDGKSFADDGIELNREAYFRNLHTFSTPPTTAAPPPAVAGKVLHEWFEGADHLIVLTVPARLSAINNSMRLGAADLPQERVTILDSGQLSMGLGWQVIVGAEVAAKTGSVEQTLHAIDCVRRNQVLYAGLATMEFLRRSGRVSWAQASIGALLQIKPVIQVLEGEVSAVARVRTFSRAIDSLIELAHKHTPLDKLAILHINNLEGAAELRARLKDIMPEDTITTGVGPTLGTHIGPGALGIALVNSAWKAS
jgi:DegV family protein with EDD domain